MKPELGKFGYLIIGPTITRHISKEEDYLEELEKVIAEENLLRKPEAHIDATDVYYGKIFTKNWRGAIIPDPAKQRGPFNGPHNITEEEWDRKFISPAIRAQLEQLSEELKATEGAYGSFLLLREILR